MSDVERYANDLKELSRYATEFKSKVSKACGGSFDWGVEEVIKSYLAMFDRFCQFKVGDRVKLIKSCKIKEGHGWYSSRHFLKKGAMATIEERGYSKSGFTFQIVFDNETYIHPYEKIEKPVTSKHTFHFSENDLEAATP